EGRESSLRGRAPGPPRRAAGLPHLGAADLADAAGALALPHEYPGHVLRARGGAADLPARSQGRDPTEARRDLRGATRARAPGDESGTATGGVPGLAGDRRVRLRSADVPGLNDPARVGRASRRARYSRGMRSRVRMPIRALRFEWVTWRISPVQAIWAAGPTISSTRKESPRLRASVGAGLMQGPRSATAMARPTR